MIILDKVDYLNKTYALLNDVNTYNIIKSNPLSSLQNSFNKGINAMIKKHRTVDNSTGICNQDIIFKKFLNLI